MSKISISRQTNETNIELSIDFDKSYSCEIDCPLGFLNHMLNTFAKYLDIHFSLKASGDLYVDSHHLIEDIGIVLGQVLNKHMTDNKKIKRFAHTILPMDDSLILMSLDLSGRSYLNYDVSFKTDYISDIPTENFKEFFLKFTNQSMINLHIQKLAGENSHHIIENIFKALGLCLKDALKSEKTLLSTKGTLGG